MRGILGIKNASGTSISQSAIGNRYTFQGRETDWQTGLMYFRARWYNPETGRWLSKDLIGIAGGLNMYVFCGNNPVNFVDPSGLCEERGGWDKFVEGWWAFWGSIFGGLSFPSGIPDTATVCEAVTRATVESRRMSDYNTVKEDMYMEMLKSNSDSQEIADRHMERYNNKWNNGD